MAESGMSAPTRPANAMRTPAGAESPSVGGTIDYGRLSDSLGYALRRVQLAIFNSFIRAFAAADIRPAQYAVLTVIARNPGLKQSQISAALGIHRTNLVAMLDALEQRGLARREPVPADRRSYALRLTAKGKALMSELDAIQAAEEARVVTALGEGGRDQLFALLSRLDAALAADAGAPAGESEE